MFDPSDPATALAVAVGIVLALGAALGLTARRLLSSRNTLSGPAAVLSGIAGAGLGGAAAHLATGSPRVPEWLPLILLSIAGTVAVLVIAERFARRPEPTVLELINTGESARTEFKSTARHNLRTGQRDDKIELVIAKTVAAFLNADGGVLIVGVDDEGTVLGLDEDLQHMQQPDLDRYELWLHDYLTRTLGATAVSTIDVAFPAVGGRTVCTLTVRPSPRPVFLRPPKSDQVRFYTRMGNSSRELAVNEAITYAIDHFRRGRRPPQI